MYRLGIPGDVEIQAQRSKTGMNSKGFSVQGERVLTEEYHQRNGE
jgi:hypothetical protein